MTRILSVAAFLLAATLGSFLPNVIQAQDDVALPEPSGPYKVGQADYYLVDETRHETFTEDPDDVRELQLTVYYPAEPAPDAQPAHYFANDAYRRLPQHPFESGFLENFYAHSYSDAPLASAETNYPVLVYSPGVFAPPQLMTTIAEALASHGYIVVGIWHPYSTQLTLFPNGRIAEADFDIDSSEMRDVTEIWVEDTEFVLNQLSQLNDDDLLLGHAMDLSRTGAFGWSVGGASTLYALQRNSHLLAGAMLDHTQFYDMNAGLEQPALFMLSSGNRLSNTFTESVEQGYSITIHGAYHENFSDSPYLAPKLLFPIQTGPIDVERATEIITTYLIAFFDKHLKGDAEPLFDGPSSDFEDVTFEFLGELAE